MPAQMLTPELAAFVEGGQCMHIGTRDEDLVSTGGLVVATVVDADRTHVTAFVPRADSRDVLTNLKANGQVALCLCRPVDDHACQIKGVFVSARAATKAERSTIDGQWGRSLQQLEQLSIPRQLWSGYKVWPCVAVRIRVTAVFDQTPGPGAGAPLA